jgi:uncharacterized protein YbcI
MTGSVEAEAAGASRVAELTTSVVRLFRERTGRGPTRARAELGADHVVLILREVETTAERTMTGAGLGATVHGVREALRATMEPDLCALVADATGRRIEQMLSDHSAEHDTTVLVFLFERA